MSLDAVSRAYILAGLRIGENLDGFVDSYYGPTYLQSEAEQASDEMALMSEFEAEVEKLPHSPRRSFFEAQLHSMRTALNVDRGLSIPYQDEVESIYGISPEFTDETLFEDAHTALDQLLPGTGCLQDRLQTYRDSFTLDSEQIEPVIQRLSGELRALTQSLFALPEGESASINLVQDQPWSGYNWYLGELQSRIEINTDLPVRINNLPDLVAHEIYCGHHTEHALKESHLYRRQGYGETSIALLTSTQATISEGIATSAFEVLVPESEQSQWLGEHCYGPAGVEIDVDRDLAIAKVLRPLQYVSENAALLLHEQGKTKSEVVDYICRWGLRDRKHAQQTVNFITTPILRTYIFCYARGYELVQPYLDRADDRQAAFRSLLTEHWTPQLLRDSTGKVRE